MSIMHIAMSGSPDYVTPIIIVSPLHAGSASKGEVAFTPVFGTGVAVIYMKYMK